MQTTRLFEIIYILLHRKQVSAGELADQLGVSTRTIYRDIDTLSLAGIPVFSQKGKGGGIRLMPDFVLNKSMLSEQEQNEILSALHGLATIRTDDTRQVLEKLSATFNKTARNWLEVDFSEWHYENDFFNELKVAILERRIAQFDYYNSAGEKTARRVEPIQLWFKSTSWYLKAFCLTKQDMRIYKLSRIKDLVVGDERFSERDLLLLLDDSAREEEMPEMITLKLRIGREMAYRVYDDFLEREIEKQADGSFLITGTTPETQGLIPFLLPYGRYLEVLEPAQLRARIKAEAEQMLKKHG